jgi:hypothetical protein
MIRTSFHLTNAQFVYGASQISFQAGPKLFFRSHKSLTPQASMSLHMSGLDKSISVFLFLLFFFFSATHLFSGFHSCFT